MNDHTYPIMDSLRSSMEDITEAVREEHRRDEGEGGEHSTLDELVLCVEVQTIKDVMLGVGGPTRWIRFVFNSDSVDEMDLHRVEFHDSWGANDITSVTLSDEETATVVDALGWMVGIQ